ncbi:hypothetical protein FGG08_006337 [Glutinoglossum americanum]|uniref:C2H2-type domain-containing protein n=1 Tax=Glutinoglossum americanum TaxID=1670608 RepID=A0A9P8L0I0_9PEZI|nr:hypothetical protein FGG08_006337 [Glutinoglossum americanum]
MEKITCPRCGVQLSRKDNLKRHQKALCGNRSVASTGQQVLQSPGPKTDEAASMSKDSIKVVFEELGLDCELSTLEDYRNTSSIFNTQEPWLFPSCWSGGNAPDRVHLIHNTVRCTMRRAPIFQVTSQEEIEIKRIQIEFLNQVVDNTNTALDYSLMNLQAENPHHYQLELPEPVSNTAHTSPTLSFNWILSGVPVQPYIDHGFASTCTLVRSGTEHHHKIFLMWTPTSGIIERFYIEEADNSVQALSKDLEQGKAILLNSKGKELYILPGWIHFTYMLTDRFCISYTVAILDCLGVFGEIQAKEIPSGGGLQSAVILQYWSERLSSLNPDITAQSFEAWRHLEGSFIGHPLFCSAWPSYLNSKTSALPVRCFCGVDIMVPWPAFLRQRHINAVPAAAQHIHNRYTG